MSADDRIRRYDQSAKGRARHERYRATAKGKAWKQRNNAKRLRAGRAYLGYESDGLTRQQIQDHIDRRVREFKESQCRSVETRGKSAN